MNGEGVQVVHFIPGRVRFRVERVKHDPGFTEEIKNRFSDIEGIKDIEINSLTGSVLVSYDEQQVNNKESFKQVTQAIGDLFPSLDLDQVKSYLKSQAGLE